jgi:hypothetical protein
MPANERQRTPFEVAENLDAWLNAMQKDGHWYTPTISSPQEGVNLNLADLQMVVAVLNAIAYREDGAANREFLEAADRAVRGWRAANGRQVKTISGLMDKFQKIRFAINGEESPLALAIKEILDA